MQIASVLFAAGRGVRLRPLTDRLPKPAVPVLDVPLGAYPLSALLEEFPPALVNVSHLPRVALTELRRAVGSDPRLEVLIEEPEAFGAGGTLKALAGRIGPRFVTCNADLLTDLRPQAVMAAHRSSGASATVAVLEVDRGADFDVDGDRAVGFIDRRTRSSSASARFMGMGVFEREVLDLIPPTRPAGLAESALRTLADRGDLGVFVHRGYARDVGSPKSYLDASIDVLAGRVGPPQPLPGEVVTRDGGRAYIGPGVRAEIASIGRDAILLAGCSIEPGARVERAIVWPGERVPADVTVTDAILAGGQPVPAT